VTRASTLAGMCVPASCCSGGGGGDGDSVVDDGTDGCDSWLSARGMHTHVSSNHQVLRSARPCLNGRLADMPTGRLPYVPVLNRTKGRLLEFLSDEVPVAPPLRAADIEKSESLAFTPRLLSHRTVPNEAGDHRAALNSPLAGPLGRGR
jgi:hypothetical protein